MSRASLVLLGASALHADGALYSRAGTALVATLAKEYRVPVVACVETYKFGERVALDGVGLNELGDPKDVLRVPNLEEREVEGLNGLVLMYDLTAPELITTVCTEVGGRLDSRAKLIGQIGFIPPRSVPTVLGKASGMA